jgi:hypothetical protein
MGRIALKASVGQGIDQPGVGAATDFSVAPEIRDPFAHRAPPTDELAVGTCRRGQDLEFCRIVEGGLDSKDVAAIVEFDRVAADAKLDAAAFGAPLAVDDDLAGEGMVGPAAEEAHEVGRAETDDGGVDEIGVNAFEVGSGLEQNVRGRLHLIAAEPVAAGFGTGRWTSWRPTRSPSSERSSTAWPMC